MRSAKDPGAGTADIGRSLHAAPREGIARSCRPGVVGGSCWALCERTLPMTKQPTVLVTGGAGYVGSHACKALHRAGFTPVTLDNLATGHRSAVKWGPLEVGDIRDEDLVADV